MSESTAPKKASELWVAVDLACKSVRVIITYDGGESAATLNLRAAEAFHALLGAQVVALRHAAERRERGEG